jgi:hypothetical protein
MSAPHDPTHPKAFEADESLSRPDQDDVEGHRPRWNVQEDDADGNMEPETDDVEGHGTRFKF